MACVARSVMSFVDKEDVALGKEKVISVMIAKDQNTFKKMGGGPSAFKHGSLSQIVWEGP